MARLPPPVTMITCSIPLAIASSTPYWIVGLSTRGSISFGCALVTGRKRVPRPAAGKIAFLTRFVVIKDNVGHGCGELSGGASRPRRPHRARHRRQAADPARRREGRVRDARDDRLDGDDRAQLARAADPAGLYDGRLRGARPPPGAVGAGRDGRGDDESHSGGR